MRMRAANSLPLLTANPRMNLYFSLPRKNHSINQFMIFFLRSSLQLLVTENDDLRVGSPCQRVRTQRNAFVREASHRNLHKIGLLSLIEPHEQR